jgi:uncharacterized membrane protein
MYKVIAFFICLVILIQCKKKETKKAYGPSCGGTKSFVTDVKPLIQNYCVSCHNSYGTYSGIKSASSSIRSSILDGNMPKGTTLSDDQKNNIICWIDADMLNN